jgi:hypothetical protein
VASLDRVLEEAARVEAEILRRGWEFCFIGGVAIQVWGEVRMTGDVDLSLLTGWGDEESYLDGLEQFLEYRFENGRDFALTRRVGLFRAPSGIAVDVALAAVPFEAGSVQRAVEADFGGGRRLRVCSATDLIVHKAFANRPLDWEDIDAILVRSGHLVDREAVVQELAPLAALKEEPEIVDRFRTLAERVERREREERGKSWGHL